MKGRNFGSRLEQEKPKNNFYSESDVEVLDNPLGSNMQEIKTEPIIERGQEPVKDLTVEMKQPNKLYRRNITLSEEQFRKLELIKKMKNKERGKEDELVTLDKLMFDMIQMCLDSNQYPEVNAAFEKYVELKKLGYGDLI
jgi:hypothetical protein